MSILYGSDKMKRHNELLLRAETLVMSGDDAGCDGLVVVSEMAFNRLKAIVEDMGYGE